MRLPLLRTSERTAFKRCPQRWWWGYRQGLVPQGPPNEKLWFGEGIHLALALWYVPGRIRGKDPRETWREFVDDDIRFMKTEFDREHDVQKYADAGDFGEELLTNYLDKYDTDEDWEIIAPEQEFSIILYAANGKPYVHLKGRLDGVYRDLADSGNVKILENKTAKDIRTSHLELDDQRSTYYTVAQQCLRDMGMIKEADRVVEMTYNFLRKGHKDERPTNELGQALNKDGTVSKNQPRPLFHREPIALTRREMQRQLAKIEDEVHAMNLMRRKELKPWKTPTFDCTWDCDFYEMCCLDEGNPDDVPEFKRAVYRVQDPYAQYRKSAGLG